MKKLMMFFCFIFILKLGYCQSLTGGSFEIWDSLQGTPPTNYYFEIDTANHFWGTLNSLAALSAYVGGPGPVTCEKTTDAQDGKYAAQLVSKKFYAIFIPGMLGTTTLDIPQSTIFIGRPYTYKPLRFKGYIKYFPVNGDSAIVLLLLSKYNAVKKNRDTIAYTEVKYKDTVSKYTLFDTAIHYFNANTAPDSITILFVSSAGFNLKNLEGCAGQLNSTLYVDNVSITFPVGIENILPKNPISIYPNPATDRLNVILPNQSENYRIIIYNAIGDIILNKKLTPGQNVLLTTDLGKGMYYYQIYNSDNISEKGKLLILKY